MKFKHAFFKVTTRELVEEQLKEARRVLTQAQDNREAAELDVRLSEARIAVLEQYQRERPAPVARTYTEGGFVPSPAAKT